MEHLSLGRIISDCYVRQRLYIEEYDWTVDVFYSVDKYSYLRAIYRLEYIGCPFHLLNRITDKIKTEKYNYGVTYSNNKCTVIIISHSTSDEEFMNTLEHEKQHMIGHIIDHYGIKPSSEEAGYLAGYVGALFTKPIKDEICDCCKKKLK